MGTLLQDLRYGLRMLRKNPGFTAVAVLTLALGIGANSAIFTVVNSVLLHPLHYKAPDRLVVVLEKDLQTGSSLPVTPANFIDWRNRNQVFELMAAALAWAPTVTHGDESEKMMGLLVSPSLFPLLGIQPALGRTILPGEDQAGRNRVVVLGDGLWRRRFDADPSLLGRTVTLDGESYTVVGIMPPDFHFPPFWVIKAELWAPLALDAKQMSNRRSHYLRVFARLKTGVTREQAQAAMGLIARQLGQEYPNTNTGVGATVDLLYEKVVGQIRLTLLVLFGSVGFVLLIACANLANLQLARATARQREVAIRTALGASRLRLLRQLLTESILLSLLGGTLGLVLALWGLDLLMALAPANTPRLKEIRMDAWVLGFTWAISLGTGVLFGLAPAVQASKMDLTESLKEGGRALAGAFRVRRLHSLLVIAEVALALMLLIGAGLMIQSFLRLRAIEPGFNLQNLLTMQISLPKFRYAEGHKMAAFYQQLLQRVGALPGIQSVGMIHQLPIGGDHWAIGLSIEGRPAPSHADAPGARFSVISPNYFHTMGIPLLKGRDFTERDVPETPGVVIINQTMARRFFANEDPIGKRLKLGPPESNNPWLSIVGVVGDVKQRKLDAAVAPELYLPYLQGPSPDMTLVGRTAYDPLNLAAAVRRTVWATDKDIAISNSMSMEQILSASIAQQRFSMLLLGLFALLAVLLAAVGVYGVINYSVTQRTHEIGIRMALGARPSDVLKLVVRQGMALALMGVAIGLTAALALTRVLSSLLYGISATDPMTFVGTSLLFAGVALLASYLPARRATRIDPMVTLRYE